MVIDSIFDLTKICDFRRERKKLKKKSSSSRVRLLHATSSLTGETNSIQDRYRFYLRIEAATRPIKSIQGTITWRSLSLTWPRSIRSSFGSVRIRWSGDKSTPASCSRSHQFFLIIFLESCSKKWWWKKKNSDHRSRSRASLRMQALSSAKRSIFDYPHDQRFQAGIFIRQFK